ncbi:uncharacterized protein [Nothobranchius furzeri]|uniref:uncharacterized protein n=1 Tax=Nothobranchius furzeri TaxID=105023 RepID=UPI003904CE37
MQGDNEHILKDIAIRKMTEMLSQVLVVVKEVSRDVQFIKSELADGKITPAGCEGPLPDTVQQMLPIQLPITSEDDFNKAELLLKNEPDRQKMIARLALVGGTTSTCMIRRMLVTVLTNTLACKFNWAGKKRTPHDSKQPFKDNDARLHVCNSDVHLAGGDRRDRWRLCSAASRSVHGCERVYAQFPHSPRAMAGKVSRGNTESYRFVINNIYRSHHIYVMSVMSKACFTHHPLPPFTAIGAAARQYDRHLMQQAFSDTVKKWLRYAPWRAGGKKNN